MSRRLGLEKGVELVKCSLTAALSTNDVEIDRNIAARFSREPPSRGARGLRLHGLPEAVKGENELDAFCRSDPWR